jgi:hypothetical protein
MFRPVPAMSTIAQSRTRCLSGSLTATNIDTPGRTLCMSRISAFARRISLSSVDKSNSQLSCATLLFLVSLVTRTEAGRCIRAREGLGLRGLGTPVDDTGIMETVAHYVRADMTSPRFSSEFATGRCVGGSACCGEKPGNGRLPVVQRLRRSASARIGKRMRNHRIARKELKDDVLCFEKE